MLSVVLFTCKQHGHCLMFAATCDMQQVMYTTACAKRAVSAHLHIML